MLHRAALQSLRLNPSLIRPASLTFQLRNYSKSNKPKKTSDYKIPPSASGPSAARHGPSASRTSQVTTAGGATVALGSSDKSGRPDYSKDQDEFQTSTPGEENTMSISQDSGPDTARTGPAKASSHPEYSKLQDEFQTSSASDHNTTPQDTSPSTINPAEARKNEEAQQIAEDVPPPLHDLTKGIPSTLDAELAQANVSARPQPGELGIIDASRSSTGGRGKGQMPASAYITSADRRRNRMMNWMLSGIFLLVLAGPVYLGRNWETEEEEKKHLDTPSGWGVGLFYSRAKARLADTLDYFNEPAFPKLLPDTDPSWERPYTLVLSLEDLLVHSEWTREHGWRMAKRPGVDYFLRYLSQYYELVIFTSVPSMIAEPVIRKLDPWFRIIMWPLFREATRYKNGEYIKDLSYLNRPLSKVLLVDTVPSHAKLQPENAIILPKWTGSPNDKELVSLIPFLEYVATMNPGDTRTVLSSFEGKHIPTEFSRREQVARQRFNEQLAAERAKRPKRSSAGGWLGNALGIRATDMMPRFEGEQSLSEAQEQGKMLQDVMRERGQKNYEFIEKDIRDNGDSWLKEMTEQQEKQMQESVKGMKAGLTGGWFGGGGGEKKG